MPEQLTLALLFGSAAVSAFIAAFREDIFPKVQKLALAVALAASGLFVRFTDFSALVD